MSDNSINVNQTIINMISNLKRPVSTNDSTDFEFNTPLKRSISSASDSSNSNLSSTQTSSIKSRMSFEGPTPVKRPKMAKKYDITYIGSPREIRRLRSDLVEARNTILTLETRIDTMHNVRKKLELVFNEETHTLKKQHEYDKKTIEELENQLQDIRKREAQLKQELVDLQDKYEKLKLNSDRKQEELEKSLSELQSESKFLECQESSEISSLNRRILELEDALSAAEDEASGHKKLSAELEKQAAEKNALLRDMELKDIALQKAKQQIKEFEYEKENIKEYEEQVKAQARKLAHYPELVKENERLKEDNFRLQDEVKNKLLLEEEVHNLKIRLVNFKEQEKKLSNLQMQQVQLELYLEEWRSVARSLVETSSSDLTSPRVLKSTLERLQQQEINLTSEKVELESQLKTALHDFKVAKSELEKHQKLLTDLKTSGQQKQHLIHRLQKKVILLTRERDSYRSQLDSYEKDLTMNINLNATNTLATSAVNQLQAQKDRIENLEKVVEGYRDMVAKLENDLQSCQPGLLSDVAPIRIEQITRLQNELDQLREENQRLRDRKDQLEVQLETFLVGHDSVLGGKVYHQEKNPLVECITQRENHIQSLEEQVEKLKIKVKNLEEGIETSKLDISISPKEIKALKDQNKLYEVKYERMKEHMKTSMQEYRNVIYMLLGYKVDRSNSLFKLTSTYAERIEDQLCFQLNQDGTLNLLENEFSATLEDFVNLHLRQQNSIPVFLSAITMDLFQNKTASTAYEEEEEEADE